MGKIEVPDTHEALYYWPEKILCMQTAGKHTAYFIINPEKEKGYEIKTPCGNLGLHQQKVKHLNRFMRVHDNSVVNLQHVGGVSRKNIIKFDTPRCDLEVELKPALRPEFKRRMQSFTALLLPFTFWAEGLVLSAA